MPGQRVCYIQVSTLDQNPDRQLDGVQLDRAFTDKASGQDVARPQLAELLRFVREPPAPVAANRTNRKDSPRRQRENEGLVQHRVNPSGG
jgi:DNA invertase Pin-like site-specific DNA recombinase